MLDWLRKILNRLKNLFKRQEDPKPKFSVVIDGVEYLTDDVEELNAILSRFGAAILASKQESNQDSSN